MYYKKGNSIIGRTDLWTDLVFNNANKQNIMIIQKISYANYQIPNRDKTKQCRKRIYAKTFQKMKILHSN